MSILKKLKTGKIKTFALIFSAIVIITAVIGGTVAWLSDNQTVINSFSVSKVKCEVNLEETGTVKQNIKVENTGEVEEYVRATIVVSWIDGQGDTVAQTVIPSDYTMSLNNTDWFKGSDGYYYYKEKVEAGAQTENLINSFTADTTYEGQTLKLDVVASAIQGDPKTAVESVWTAVQVDTSGNLISK